MGRAKLPQNWPPPIRSFETAFGTHTDMPDPLELPSLGDAFRRAEQASHQSLVR